MAPAGQAVEHGRRPGPLGAGSSPTGHPDVLRRGHAARDAVAPGAGGATTGSACGCCRRAGGAWSGTPARCPASWPRCSSTPSAGDGVVVLRQRHHRALAPRRRPRAVLGRPDEAEAVPAVGADRPGARRGGRRAARALVLGQHRLRAALAQRAAGAAQPDAPSVSDRFELARRSARRRRAATTAARRCTSYAARRSISHLECATFVYTRTPYDPEAPIPG